ncbi:MAG: carbon-nitrogen hydrolase family protein [Pseudomonadota bacterium]
MKSVAAIQLCSSHILKENLEITAKLIKEASDNSATLVVLPEMFPIFGLTQAAKVDFKEDFGTGKIQAFLSEQAKKNSIWLVGGTIPLSCEDKDKIKAACLVYDNNGRVVARYDKIHLFDAVISKQEVYLESDTTNPGNSLVVVNTPIGKLGLAVCYDIRFPTMFTHLFNQGAEVIAIPSAFTQKTGEAHWELLARSRALDNFCYVIGACQGGTHSNGRKTYGHSLIVDPWGSIVTERIKKGPGIIYAEINLKKLHEIRNTIPIASHQKLLL